MNNYERLLRGAYLSKNAVVPGSRYVFHDGRAVVNLKTEKKTPKQSKKKPKAMMINYNSEGEDKIFIAHYLFWKISSYCYIMILSNDFNPFKKNLIKSYKT